MRMLRSRLMWSFLLLILAMPAVPTAAAENLSLVINGRSFHLGSSYDWNEDNVGLGIEYSFDSTSRWRPIAMANAFRDSNNRMSYMIGGGLHRRLFATDRLSGLYLDAGLNVFLMTREDVNENRPFPGVLPSLSVGNRHLGLNVTYLPKIAIEKLMKRDFADPAIDGIVFVQLKVSIDRLLPGN